MLSNSDGLATMTMPHANDKDWIRSPRLIQGISSKALVLSYLKDGQSFGGVLITHICT